MNEQEKCIFFKIWNKDDSYNVSKENEWMAHNHGDWITQEENFRKHWN